MPGAPYLPPPPHTHTQTPHTPPVLSPCCAAAGWLVFQEKERRRGITDLFQTLAERLHEHGRGVWPLRPVIQVQQKWNNIAGVFKVGGGAARVCVCRL